jgi:F0F1-type ATP synthase membrane subunit b/b'
MTKRKQSDFDKIPLIFKLIGGILILLLITSFFNAREKNLQRMKVIQSDIEDARDEAEQAKQDAEDARQEAEDARDDAERQRIINNLLN